MNYLSYIKTVTASLVRFVVYSYQQHFISLQFIFPKSYANSLHLCLFQTVMTSTYHWTTACICKNNSFSVLTSLVFSSCVFLLFHPGIAYFPLPFCTSFLVSVAVNHIADTIRFS